MPNTATLLVDIGSTTTRVTLADTVAGELRLVGQAEVQSTFDLPHRDALVGVLQAAIAIGEVTGRQLLDGSQLLRPSTAEGDGVDQVFVVTSAAGPMGLVVAAVSSETSARSALHASHAVQSAILQTITLNDTAEHTVATGDYAWIERQVQRLIGLNPDAIVLAGGLEDGAQDALVRLAHIIGLAALSARVDDDGQAHQEVAVRPVVYAGNSRISEQVIESLSNKAETIVVENLRPTLEHANLEPTRRALGKLYSERILGRMPGLEGLRRIAAAPIRTTTDALRLITQFLAELHERNVLAIDFGSASTSMILCSQGSVSTAVLGEIGSGYGLATLLGKRGPAAFQRWLPFPRSEQEVTHALLNKYVRPQLLPATRESILIEHAVAREAIALAAATLFDERPSAAYDMVLACGGVLAHAPHPGYALLSILDALQPMAEGRAVDVYLDTLGLINATGALAYTNADGAYSLIEHDLMQNTPLATCVVALGNGKIGEQAVEARLRIVGGGEYSVTVNHGQIGRLELPPGQVAQLVLKPASGVRVAGNAPGAAIETGAAEISGSLLGVVIDARGRPLRLPVHSLERQRALWDWLVALGAESGPLPYEAAEALAEVADASAPEVTISTEELVQADPNAPTEVQPATPPTAPEPAPRRAPKTPPPTPQAEVVVPPPPQPRSSDGMDGDLAKLRQTVEQPKKRGLFGRK